MSDLLSIGASGVRAYQTALSTVGENIANAGSSTYARRSVELKEVSAGQGLSATRMDAGMGVAVGGIARSTDVYAGQAVRSAGADLSRTTTGTTWLGRIQSALTGDQVSNRLTSFFSAASSLAADPTSSALRANLLGTATTTAAAFTATGNAFDRIDQDFDASALNAARDLTSFATSLARINDGLGRTQPGTAAAAQLADQRDQILQQMSDISTVSATFDQVGRATVKAGGANGPTLVWMTEAGAVSYRRNAEGAVSFSVAFGGDQTPLATEGGAIAGLVDGAEKIAAARTTLNDIATSFVKTVNDVQASGDDLDRKPGGPLFATGADATDITVAMTDGRGIAASARGGGVRDASNLAMLQVDRVAKGFEANTTALVTSTASAIDQKNTIADAQAAIRQGALTTLSTTTGVSLDSEAVDLMRFQQAYSASSRVIQVARDTFQSILEIR
ncbi:flagellar hook-associated protein 1 FlgK [Sphingomonas gellani]|uniref:Flagellar hook-associated protein 1 n=1 Tax=Sphingomonas gellani TaxID=1166340 RepID=A0A1H8CLI3_9SPHN|nr:flagellar hook-associated protein FlgK [Sphingomonas gellani]SEM95759.1 flagellar hook-associated protein 1 FlgK [Sphingomonas gellani]